MSKRKGRKKNKGRRRQLHIMFDIYWDCCHMMDCDLTYKEAKAILKDVKLMCECGERKIFIERVLK